MMALSGLFVPIEALPRRCGSGTRPAAHLRGVAAPGDLEGRQRGRHTSATSPRSSRRSSSARRCRRRYSDGSSNHAESAHRRTTAMGHHTGRTGGDWRRRPRCPARATPPPAPAPSGYTSSTAASSTSHPRASSAITSRTAEVGETRMSVPCFLIAHPSGTLMWDARRHPRDDIVRRRSRRRTRQRQSDRGGRREPDAAGVSWRRSATALPTSPTSPCRTPHIDHTANLQPFAALDVAGARGRARVHVGREQPARQAAFYTALKNSRTVVLDKDEHDVFGDGQVDHQGRARAHAGAPGARPAIWRPPDG